MTAAGKITAARVAAGDRILVKHYSTESETDREVLAYLGKDAALGISSTKTGAGVTVARVLRVEAKLVTGGRRDRRVYDVHTTEGILGNNVPAQTMWLAPEDNAGVKRAHVEALAEQAERWKAGMDEILDEALAEDEARSAVTMDISLADSVALSPWLADRLAAELASQEAEEGAERFTLTETQIEENAAESEAHNREDAEAAREENEAPGGIYAQPTPGRELTAQMVGRVLRAPELTFQLPLLPHGRELVRMADLRELVPASPLTLHSQAGKVDTMNNASETQTAAQPTEAQTHTGSTVVALIERVWDRIRADHPELPAVVVTTGSGEGVKWGHFRPNSWKTVNGEKRHEFFLASEALAKGALQVLQTTIHEAAHTLSNVRGQKDTSRQNRYHNGTFCKTAVELGLEHKAASPDKTHGYSFVTLTEATKVKYAELLAELERELKLTGLLPFWMGGSDDEDERGGERITGKPTKTQGEDERGGERITGKPTKTQGEGETKSGPVKAVCDCEEPVIIRLSQKVMDLGVVRCDSCRSLFHRP